MFKSVPLRVSPDPASPTLSTPFTADEDDDDTISLTSMNTEDHEDGAEFVVERIRMEKKTSAGMYYLVEWENYPLDKCTWEPAHHIGEFLMKEWEQIKERQRLGEEEAWTMETWDAIEQRARDEKADLHRRRNARRKKLGLPLTEPISDSDQDESESSSDNDSWEGEAEVDRMIVDQTADNSRPNGQPKPTAPRKPSAVTSGSASRRPKSSAKPATTAAMKPSTEARPRPDANRLPYHDLKPASRVERPSATGYQGTARKPSTSSASAGIRGRLVSSSGAPGDKRLTARKSAVVGATNVFSGGTTRKKRVGITDAAADSTKDPKLFGKYRQRRLLEKGSRDMEDRPPPVLPVLFDISSGPSKKGMMSEPISAVSETFREAPSAVEKENSITVPWTDSSTPIQTKKKKKKKSVRFSGDEADLQMFVDEPLSMDLDSPMVGSPSQIDGQESVGILKSVTTTGSVTKILIFGRLAPESEAVLATMDGLPKISNDLWLSDFLETSTLRMAYTCNAKDFIDQKDYMWQTLLCDGTVSSSSSEPLLESVAGNLRDSQLGLYCSTPGYNLLIYPASCEEWRWWATQQGVKTVETGPGLRYFVFSSVTNIQPFLRPANATISAAKAGSFGSYRESLMRRLFKLDYQALLPDLRSDGLMPTHCFFLAFPRNKGDWLVAVGRWLRACHPSCRIYTSYQQGGWESFRNAGQGFGVVIVHELLSSSLHRMPDLWTRLNSYRDIYWCLSEAIQPRPMFPSWTLEMVPLGKLSFTELFPAKSKRDRKHVILLTPSFVTSEPLRTLEVLEWAADQRRGLVANIFLEHKLVTAHNIHEYLGELAEQKANERQKVLEQYDVLRGELAANVRGLSRDDCEYRFKAVSLALELEFHRSRRANEEFSALVYADPWIDPNDEQSLVNWFGWWTSMRMDQYRGFHVMGSDNSMKFNGSKRGERLLRIPRYSQCTINDPDLVRQEVQRTHGPAPPIDEPPAQPVTGRAVGFAATTPSRQLAPWSFQSKRIAVENVSGFTNALFQINKTRAIFSMLYGYPVSWTDRDMSYHFGDAREEFRTYSAWWDYTFPFFDNRSFSTYIGFFYTIADEWDPATPPLNKKPARHPWIGVYRAVEAHNRSAEFCELIIWDPAAKKKYPTGHDLREEDLMYAQRQLIQFVREHTGEKNKDSVLHQVWYGGFDDVPDVDPPYPIDVTFEYLGRLVKSPNYSVPSKYSLASRGFRYVHLKGSPEGHSPDSSVPMDIDTPGGSGGDDDDNDDDDDDTRIIFHPPRPTNPPQGRSKCVNHLYEAARAAREEARRSGRREMYMKYEFPVTAEWWDSHRFEGRGFEHLYVGPWEPIFNKFRIPQLKRKGEPNEPPGQGLRGSVGSVDVAGKR